MSNRIALRIALRIAFRIAMHTLKKRIVHNNLVCLIFSEKNVYDRLLDRYIRGSICNCLLFFFAKS